MSGIIDINNVAVMDVLREYTPKPKKRLRLLQEIRAFANGIIKAINEKTD